MENGLSSRMVFQDEAIHFSRSGADHTAPRKPTAAAGFVMDGDKMFSGDRRDDRFVRSQYGSQNLSWNVDLDGGSPSGDGSDGEDEEEEEEDDDDDDVEDDDLDDGDGAVDGFEGNKIKNSNNSNGGVQSCSGKVHGLSRGMMKDGSLSEQQQQNDRVGSYENAITVVEPELYCAQILHGGDGLASVQKEIGGENGYGFGGRKEIGLAVDPRESLRKHLLDPITGALMDDAMILSCGHSFGSGGMKQVFRMKACCKCSQPISEDLVRPNLALRSAVQAFCREEESQSSKASKRRRDRFEQINDKCSYNDPYSMDTRGKGVQFPFVVSDRVIIKGNKRTPQRFVGRVAVVTTQCLNGWYVVKTLDNAESVKLQYRSLAKVSDDSPSNMIQKHSKLAVMPWCTDDLSKASAVLQLNFYI